jgi:hypothetical protein
MYNHIAKIIQRLKDMVPKKKFVLSIESWIFIDFKFIFLSMVLYDVIFNVLAMI